MAGTLTVQNLQGPSSGANANKIIVPSGQTLHAAGHVVQVAHGTQAGNSNTSTSTAWQDTGLSVSITPTSDTSKILVFASTIVGINSSPSLRARIDLRLTNSDVSEISFESRYQGTDDQSTGNLAVISSPHGYFSPASTSAQTYKVQARPANGSSNETDEMYLSWYTGGTQTITAMEIAQ